ncbi:hypothetical protein CTAYLR_007115 [Chrysophaeum taylorii]|uniref:Histone-lysine N-methyltransferase, H3 lysine-79 specific n=1 Tax=Chrysophaeum taylorii TaxID=2483200 RepID=A0AAD7U769_9STRA|nr:hypothetical protein CTAYLR_007115 [Chrysophaeum taylorii]
MHALFFLIASTDAASQGRNIEAALAKHWDGLGGMFAYSARDEMLVADEPIVASYGEVTSRGARVMFEALGLDGDSVFADLGSGVGKLAAQAYLEAGVRRAIAVEFFEARHERAVEAWQRLATEGAELREDFDADALVHVCADVLDADLEGVTHAFVSNYCFGEETNARIADRLAVLPGLRRIATSRPFPPPHFPLDPARRILVDMSWAPRVVVNIYDPPLSSS